MPGQTHAQLGIVEDLLKRIIMSLDLEVQRRQTQTIILQEAQKQVENVMQATQLGAIRDWVQRQKDLYEGYYQELWEVKQALQVYSRVKNLIAAEARQVMYYRNAVNALRRDPHFRPKELDHISQVLEGILQQSIRDIGQISQVVRMLLTQMEDGERLRIIDEVADRIDRNGRRLTQFTQESFLLSVQRTKGQGDLDMLKHLYGMP